MQVQKISNNNYNNTTFGSKIVGRRIDINSATDPLKSVLSDAWVKNDRTFLKAAKALVKDGEEDVYKFIIDKSWRYREKLQIFNAKAAERKTYTIPEHGASLFRDVIVDTAREKGLISGKSVGTKTIIDTYEKFSHYPETDITDIRKSLKGKGFSFHNPKSDLDADEKALVQKELTEIENLKKSDAPDNDARILSLKIKIGQKISKQTHEELTKLYYHPYLLS